MTRPAERIGPELIGLELGPLRHEWSERDAILYSLGIGARLPEDLAFLYEGEHGPRVEPTFALSAVTRMLPPLVSALAIDLRRLLHGSQALEIHRVPPPSGGCEVTRRVVGVWDKGRAAVIDVEDVVTDEDGPLANARGSWVVMGAGEFGGERGPGGGGGVEMVEGAADASAELDTSREQAALYRLSGDLNPIHIDPAFAGQAGQPEPILHGLCTFGMLARRVAAVGPGRLCELEGRFVAPVFPGERLTVEEWRRGEETTALVSSARGAVLGPVRARFTA